MGSDNGKRRHGSCFSIWEKQYQSILRVCPEEGNAQGYRCLGAMGYNEYFKSQAATCERIFIILIATPSRGVLMDGISGEFDLCIWYCKWCPYSHNIRSLKLEFQIWCCIGIGNGVHCDVLAYVC